MTLKKDSVKRPLPIGRGTRKTSRRKASVHLSLDLSGIASQKSRLPPILSERNFNEIKAERKPNLELCGRPVNKNGDKNGNLLLKSLTPQAGKQSKEDCVSLEKDDSLSSAENAGHSSTSPYKALPPISLSSEADQGTIDALNEFLKRDFKLDCFVGLPLNSVVNGTTTDEQQIKADFREAYCEVDDLKKAIALHRLADVYAQRGIAAAASVAPTRGPQDATKTVESETPSPPAEDGVSNSDGISAVTQRTCLTVTREQLDELQNLLRASGLYHACIALCGTTASLADNARGRLTRMQRQFYRCVSSLSEEELAVNMDMEPADNPYVKRLERLRVTHSKRLATIGDMWDGMFWSADKAVTRGQETDAVAEIQQLKRLTKHELKSMLRAMTLDSRRALGTPPCACALVGVGDVTLKEATPTSDVEYVILIENGDSEALRYFYCLAVGVQLKVLSLAETPPSACGVNIVHDFYNKYILAPYEPVIRDGVKVDMNPFTHRVSPLALHGNALRGFACDDLLLIRTPLQMAQFHVGLIHTVTCAVATKLLQVTLIDGDNELVKEYRDAIAELSDWSHHAEKLRRRAADTMLRHLATIYDITPHVHGNESDVNIANLWRTVDSLPQMVYALKFMYHLESRTLTAIIDELRQSRYLTDESAYDLNTALAIGYFMRANYGNRTDHVGNGDSVARMLRGASQSMLVRLYSVIVPLTKHFRNCIGHKKRTPMMQLDLFDANADVMLHVYYRTLRYNDAERCYGPLPTAPAPPEGESCEGKVGNERTPAETYEVYTRLGLIALQGGNSKDAKSHFGRALECKNYIDDGEKQTVAFIRAWHHMGLVFLADERYERAISYFQEAVDMYRDLVDKSATSRQRPKQEFLASVHESMAHAQSRQGLYAASLTSFLHAVEYRKELIDERPCVSMLRLLMALSVLYINMADFKNALTTLKQCLELQYRIAGLHRPSMRCAFIFRHLSLVLDGFGKPMMAACYRTHALYMLESTSCEDDISSSEVTLSRDAVVTWRELAIARYYRRQYADAVQLFKRCSSQLQEGRRLALSWEAAANALNIGLALMADNQPDPALTNFQTALDMLVKIYGNRHGNLHLAKCHKSIGSALVSLRRTSDALKHLNTALEMYKAAFDSGDGHPDLADTMDQLAMAHQQSSSNQEVLFYFNGSLEMKRRLYGRVHTSIADTLQNVGLSHQTENQLDTAMSSLKQALEMYQRIHGTRTSHPDIMTVLHNIGRVHERRADRTNADVYYRRSLEMLRYIHRYEVEPRPLVTALNHIGLFYRRHHLVSQAVDAHREAMELTRRIRGDSEQLAEATATLATDYQGGELHHDAVSMFKTAIDIRRRCVEQDGLQVAHWLSSMGSGYEALGDTDAAADCHSRSLHIKKRLLGRTANDPQMVQAMAAMARAHEVRGDYRGAVPIRRQTLRRQKRLHGDRTAHADTAGSLEALANAYLQIGEYGNARKYNDEHLQMLRQLLGTPQLDGNTARRVSVCFTREGHAFAGLGDVSRAVNSHKQALELLERVGEEDEGEVDEVDIASCRGDVGNALCLDGRRVEAVAELAPAVAALEGLKPNRRQRATLGKLLYYTGLAYEAHPNYDLSLKHHQRSLDIRREIHINDDAPSADMAVSLRAVGRVSCVLGQNVEGAAVLEAGLLVLQRLHADDPIRLDIAYALLELGEAHFDSGIQTDKAITRLTDALHMMRQILGLGKAHLKIARCLAALALANQQASKGDSAAMYATQALDMYRQLLDRAEDHPTIAVMTSILGDVHHEASRFTEAVKHYKCSAQMYLSVHDNNALSPDVVREIAKLKDADKNT